MDINSIRNYYTRNNVNSVYTKDVAVKSSEASAKSSNTDIVDFGTKGTEKSTYEKAVMNYKVAYNKPTDSERIKELKKGIKFIGDYSKYKFVADEYSKKKFGRDKFKTEHSKELNSFYRAKRWIDDNPNVTTKSLKTELEKLQKQKATDEALIESNYGSLEELKRAKYIISVVMANVKATEQNQPQNERQNIKTQNQNIE